MDDDDDSIESNANVSHFISLFVGSYYVASFLIDIIKLDAKPSIDLLAFCCLLNVLVYICIFTQILIQKNA